MEQPIPEKKPEQDFKGLYKNVKISVKTLDFVIVGGILLMIVLVLFGIANNGYTVSFDSKGGTDVAAQTDLKYGDHVAEPEPPTREGYTFTGWYFDENYNYPFDFETVIVDGSTTLYARWEPKP
jgi:uncharacterized repeat protein (TIGR02543 family)